MREPTKKELRIGPLQRAGDGSFRRYGGLSDRSSPIAGSRLDFPDLLNLTFDERTIRGRGGVTKISSYLKDASLRVVAAAAGYAEIPHVSTHTANTPAGQLFYLGLGAVIRRYTLSTSATLLNKGHGAGANVQYRIEHVAASGVWRLSMYDTLAAALRTYDVADSEPLGKFRYFEVLVNGNTSVTFRYWDDAGNVTTSATTTALGGMVASTEPTLIGVSESAAATLGTDFLDVSTCEFRWAVEAAGTTRNYVCTTSNKYYIRELPASIYAELNGYYRLNDGTLAGTLADLKGNLTGSLPTQGVTWITTASKIAQGAGLAFNGKQSWIPIRDSGSVFSSIFSAASPNVPRWTLRMVITPEYLPGTTSFPAQMLLWSGTDAANPAPLGVWIDSSGYVNARFRDASGNIDVVYNQVALSSQIGTRLRLNVQRAGTGNGSLRVWIEKDNGASYALMATNCGGAAVTSSTTWSVARHCTSFSFPYTFSTALGGPCTCVIDDVQIVHDNSLTQFLGLGAAYASVSPFAQNGNWSVYAPSSSVPVWFKLDEAAGNVLQNSGWQTTALDARLLPMESYGYLWDAGLVEPATPVPIVGLWKYDRLLRDGSTRREILALSGCTLYAVDRATGATRAVGANFLKGGERYGAAQYKRRKIFAGRNGGQPKWYDGSQAYNLGIRAPQDMAFASATNPGGSIAAATYYIYVTFRRKSLDEASPIESNPSPGFPIVVGAANSKINVIRLPLSPDPQVDQRRVYISATAGGTAYLALTIDDNVTTDTTGVAAYEITAIPTTGVTLDYFNRGEAPAGGPPAVLGDFVFIGGDPAHPARVYRNTPEAIDYWNVSTYFSDCDLNDGDPVTALFTARDRVFADTRDGRGELTLTGDSLAPVLAKKTDLTYGAVGAQALCPIKDGLWAIISGSDVMVTDGFDGRSITSPPDPEAPSIERTVRAWAYNDVRGACCAFDRRRDLLIVSVPGASAQELDFYSRRLYVFSVSLQMWTRWDIPATALCISEDAQDTPSLYGGVNGFVCELDVRPSNEEESQYGDMVPVATRYQLWAQSGDTVTVRTPAGAAVALDVDIYRGACLSHRSSAGRVRNYLICSNDASGVLTLDRAMESPLGSSDVLWVGTPAYYLDLAVDFDDPLSVKVLGWLRAAHGDANTAIAAPGSAAYYGTGVLYNYRFRSTSYPSAFDYLNIVSYDGRYFVATRLGGLARTFRVRLFPTDLNDGVAVQPGSPVPSTYPPHWIEFSLEADDCPHLL